MVSKGFTIGIIGLKIVNNNAKLFGQNFRNCYDRIKQNSSNEKIIFIKAWNEWGECNYLEPDRKTGYQNLEEIKKFQNEL